jgi:hypothetical protein
LLRSVLNKPVTTPPDAWLSCQRNVRQENENQTIPLTKTGFDDSINQHQRHRLFRDLKESLTTKHTNYTKAGNRNLLHQFLQYPFRVFGVFRG